MSSFETTIGLEVHIELKTKSKAFSPSPVNFGDPANENTNVIDWGYPGVLPSANKAALEGGMMAALALNAQISRDVHWDRKNYVYPDNPKSYQVTQQQTPIGHDGYVEIQMPDGQTKRIGIKELHVEEDAGKNSHSGKGYSLVDLNRQGTPLVEIVSQPDITSPEEAYLYLEKLRQLIQFTGISDVKMQEGSMRVDINISVRPIGAAKFGTKVEIKNVNSFQYARNTLIYEEERQREELMAGHTIGQETRRFDEPTKSTILMRVKEGADDYRYFPEPDLPPIHVSDAWIDEVRSRLPEAAATRVHRYMTEFGLSDKDAAVLTQTLEMANFFDQTVANGADPKRAANYLIGDVNAYLNETQLDLQNTKLTAVNLAELIKLIDDGTISTKQAKKVFTAITEGKDPKAYVTENGLVQLSDPSKLTPMISQILDNNQQSVDDFKGGKDRAIGYLTGQVMKSTHGNANPKVVHELLLAELSKR
ncbi:MAG: Asp-tRNA(Asn)/Glu-tRNA(Gln) amidotransferase subunit GatB [Oenococcus sp.]|uniref:Aspartyl/glutamyl-tRNA(Asn/Gln) amidotransferase subunit B n=1 Tax=Oenococcus kitaharae DSM 17330 TaxID=1045004 RepID=G9WIT0_9LACO|nr:Asp-tRNA(Asn)/Glu-tRNA(Gln) amidotransferase subunit GatB [Oenococcus kitaharae]EHN58379.1 Aspartyl-tRNA(Asn) amidotransferase subunit B [Oenococcus kitaharae DSM 17330]MCV3296378.1 Asp-tRNA(Asn)/Glu-tRNA(Gln) amidotransferase subunit GatB [Oenococcus kitaharae]OEY81456.1 glutamyl-tRNA amidotransferase [Oenococcus kitaharae]OEY82944.1 glutamyl-tRNA amidotransferase [Oenococcus kitaharae]OEY84512.1 glutamyl-tRNA amidotransferase [Oenococcus kitaharae]